jgi:type IV pilus assembly protein PilX
MLNMLQPARMPQRGVVLILALIVLAAMTLAAIGLMRSVTGTNRVAGNLAFQQSALQSADVGIQAAVAWLEQRARERDASGGSANRLNADVSIGAESPVAYVAHRDDPAAHQTWETLWPNLVTANQVNTLPTDAAGNTVSFVIHRMCVAAGPPTENCEVPFVQKGGYIRTAGESQSIKEKQRDVAGINAVFYRITVRVVGPRNTSGFLQAIVSF